MSADKTQTDQRLNEADFELLVAQNEFDLLANWLEDCPAHIIIGAMKDSAASARRRIAEFRARTALQPSTPQQP